jgi:sugar phosphate isomerase/epimerase
MKFFVSSQCSARKRIGPAVEELAGLGFRNIELTGGTAWYPEITAELKALGARLDLSLMVHNYFPPQSQEFVLNLAVTDPMRQRQMMEFVRQAVTLSRDLGNRVYGVHPGFRQDVGVEQEANGFFKAGDPRLTSIDAFYGMLDELNDLACAEGVMIAIENLAPRGREDHFSFLSSEADFEHFMAYVAGKEHLGMLVDFGHMGAAAALLEFDRIRALDRLFTHPRKILEIHLSENAGPRDAHGVTKRDSWQLAYLETQLDRLGDIPVVFEWSNAATSDSVRLYDDLVQRLSVKRYSHDLL